MKTFLAKILLPIIVAGSFFGIAVPVASASSPYGCWSAPYTRACYQIAGSGSFVDFFQGELDNYSGSTINYRIEVVGPSGLWYARWNRVGPHSRSTWLDLTDMNMLPGIWCAYVWTPWSNTRECYRVIW